MVRGPVVLAAGLVISLAANAYLLARPAASGARSTAAAVGPRTPTERTPTPAAPAPAPTRSAPAAVSAARTECPAELADLAARLAAAERAVEARLSPNERFERAGRAVQLEAKVQPFLDRVFDGAPDELGHELECRGATCRLTMVEREGTEFDWHGRLQDRTVQPGDLQITGMGFRTGTPGQDAVTKEPTFTSEVLFTIAAPEAVSGLELLQGLVRDYTRASEVAACKAAHPAPGYLRLRLTLDGGSGAIAIDAGGTLAVEPAGTCLVEELRRRTAALTVPPGTLDATLFVTVDVP